MQTSIVRSHPLRTDSQFSSVSSDEDTTICEPESPLGSSDEMISSILSVDDYSFPVAVSLNVRKITKDSVHVSQEKQELNGMYYRFWGKFPEDAKTL